MSVAESGQLSEQQVDAVLAMVAAATEQDGVAPLSEHAILALRRGDRAFLAATSPNDGQIVGYGRLDPATDEEPASGEFLVHPDHRRHGHGQALLQALIASAESQSASGEGGESLRVWAHGDLPQAAALAEKLGFTRARALFQMRRPLAPELPPVTLAEGVEIRTFRPGKDDDAWLKVNARAFAHHPEQGAWTSQDLAEREAEPWFDPEGFFLAWRGDDLVGFHWTKTHSRALGEVYVVGVDPDAQGLGLGKALTLRGLHHLRDSGLETVMLYVDESNVAAVKLYESLGFRHFAVDVMYAH